MEKHILQEFNPKAKDYDEARAMDACKMYIKNTVSTKNCYAVKGSGRMSGKETSCTCVRFLHDDDEVTASVAKFMVTWRAMDRTNKVLNIQQWNRFAERDGRKKGQIFSLPTVGAEVSNHPICRNALMGILDIGIRKWKDSLKNNTLKEHGLKGKDGNRAKKLEDAYKNLDSFFKDLEKEGAPFATRLVRCETGETSLRDDNDEVIGLPPHYTKRNLYGRWLFESGYNVKMKNKSTGVLDNPEPRDDELWEGETLPIVSWTQFFQRWKDNFGHIKIRKKGADTCTDCTMFANHLDPEDSRDDRSQEELEAVVEALLDPNSNQIGVTIRDKARAHIKNYRSMRNLKNKIVEESKDSSEKHCITIDMGQNLSLPNCEADQCGDIFYLTPITVHLFGIVDNEVDKMMAYIWREDEAQEEAIILLLACISTAKKGDG